MVRERSIIVGMVLAAFVCVDGSIGYCREGLLSAEHLPVHPSVALVGAAAAWNGKDGVLCYGGASARPAIGSDFSVAYFSQLWKYSTESKRWVFVDEGPGPRSGASAVYSRGSGFVLAGGRRGNGNCLDTLWSFDPLSQEWVARGRPEIGALFPSEYGGMVLDSSDGLWYGFGNCSGFTTNTVYHRGGGDQGFVRLERTIDPHPRTGQVTAFDTRRNSLLVYGGTFYYATAVSGLHTANANQGSGEDCGQRPALIEVWSLDATSLKWTRLSRAGDGFFQERVWAFGAYSPVSDALVVVGGLQNGFGCSARYSPGYGTVFATVAAFSLRERRWKEYEVGAQLGRTHMAGAYAPELGQLIVIGGLGAGAGGDQGVSHGDGYAIQLEQRARVLLRGKHKGDAGMAVIEVEFEQANPAIVDVRLLDLDTGESRSITTIAKRMNGTSFQLRVPSSAAQELQTNERLRLVGGFEGETLGFIGLPTEVGSAGRNDCAGRPCHRDDAESRSSKVVEIDTPAIGVLALHGFRPNPATSSGRVAFSLPDGRAARLQLIDVKGRLVSDQEVGSLGAGQHSIHLSASSALPTGMYWIRLVHPERTETVRGVLSR